MEWAKIYPQLNFEAVVVLGAALISGLFIRFTPLFYPFRLLFTTVHESGHVFATLLTGGEVKGFWVYFKAKNGTLGEAGRKGGEDWFVLPAGYLGVAIFTAILLLMSGLPYLAPYAVGFVGAALLLLIGLHGRSVSTLLIGVMLAIIFIGIAWLADLIWSVFLLFLLIVLGGMSVINDWRVTWRLAREAPTGDHDAAQMAKLTHWPAWFWAITWAITSFIILAAAFWFVWLRKLSG